MAWRIRYLVREVQHHHQADPCADDVALRDLGRPRRDPVLLDEESRGQHLSGKWNALGCT